MREFIKFSLIFLIVVPLPAQDGAILPILTSSPSSKLNAMAGIGVALPSTDSFAQFYNPAQVGYAARSTNFTVHFLPGIQSLSTESKQELKSSAVNIGYRLRGRDDGRGISLGIGYVNSDLDMGETFFTDSTGNVLHRTIRNESYYSIALGLGFDYFVEVNLGLAYKWITSNPGFIQISETEIVRAIDHLGAWDYGILITVPLHHLIFKQSKNRKLRPMLDFSVGYSKTNSGSEVRYNDLIPGLPLPRTARLGYSVRGGIGITYNKMLYQAFEAYFTVEANDLLVKQEGSGFSYQGFLGDIDISRHIMKAEGDEKVSSRVGYGIELFETVFLAAGFYQGAGFDKTNTLGFGIRTKGIFRLFRKKYTKNAFSFIIESMDFQYYTSLYSVYPNEEVRYHGVMVSIGGL